MRCVPMLVLAICCTIFVGCRENANSLLEPETFEMGPIKYAKFYSIDDTLGRIKEFSIRNVWDGDNRLDKYTLVPRDCTSVLSKDISAIPYPVENVVCMSSSHVALMASLGCQNSISAISGTGFITNESVKVLIDAGEIVDIGTEELPNYEKIISLKPDVVIAYGVTGNSNSYITRLKQYGIKVLTIGEYLENDPLGKLEYIKLFGLLTEKQNMADSIFNKVCNDYLNIKRHIASTIGNGSKTKVLINTPYKGMWMIPGENNYINRLIQDAGGIILGAKKGVSHASQLSFEQVYNIALQADVWLHTNATNTLKELGSENRLYHNIPSFSQKKVYNNTLISSNGGSAFWETGTVEPHIILKDLAIILHPNLMDDKQLKYYLKLE